MPNEVIDRVHVLARRQNVNRCLMFVDRNQQPMHDDDDHDYDDDDDSTYTPSAGEEDDVDDAGAVDNLDSDDDEDHFENHYDDVVDNDADVQADPADEDVQTNVHDDVDHNYNNGCHLVMDNQFVPSQQRRKIRTHRGHKNILSYIQQRHNISDAGFMMIDWESYTSAVNKFRQQHATYTVKVLK
jgi:hypothetical protein